MNLSMMLIAILVTGTASQGCALRFWKKPTPAPVTPGPAAPVPPATGGVIFPVTQPETLSATEQKLDAPLLEMVKKNLAATAPGVKDWAAKHQLPATDGKIGVDVTCRTADAAAAVAKTIAQSGGDIVSTFQNTVFARIPAAFVQTLAERPEVWTLAASRTLARPK